MPIAIARPKLRTDPLPGFGFAILMMKFVKGWFTECGGLTIERETMDQREGGVNHYVHQLPGRIKQSRITLKHGLAGSELWDWFQQGLYNGNVERHNISIILFGPTLTVNTWWDVKDAYPIKWSGPSLNTGGNEVTVETLELVHHGLSMRDLSFTATLENLI
jgi:phage tail-like protein